MMTNKSFRAGTRFLPIFVLLLAACGPIVPATVPAQLAHTPGPPVVITERTYTNTTFQLTYPAGWRVISSPANAAPWVVLTPPDQGAVIAIGVEAADTEVPPPGMADTATIQRTVETVSFPNRTEITAAFASEESVYDALLPTFERVVESLQPPAG